MQDLLYSTSWVILMIVIIHLGLIFNALNLTECLVVEASMHECKCIRQHTQCTVAEFV